MKRRVVVTGTGLVTPLGTGTEKTWHNLCAGKSGIGLITRFDTTDYSVKIAAEVKDFNAEDFIEPKLARHLDLFVQYAVATAGMALHEAALTIDAANANRVGVFTGNGIGGLQTIEKYHKISLERGPRKITPFFIPMVISNMSAGQISIVYGAKGPNLSVTTACAAGTHAVGEAFRSISRGDCDAAITGGSESTVCPLAVGGFNAMKALSRQNENPEKACRPFDRDRDGFIISEGGGMLILEELEHAQRRGARILAEIVGFGLSGDGYHMAAPPEDGDGAVRCMRMALDDAGCTPEDIDYINAHGTSTPLNDVVETRAIKTVFGGHAYKLAVSSTKSMTGHMLGGAGGIESVFLALSIKDQIIPPTINLENPEPECDLDYVPNTARETLIRAALSNSFGFGGTNAVLVMKKFEE
ncbi:MAG: beta-ketoacyl-ACP synthase II [Desulfobulbaceae bacterium]|jgi:3-oxoacyl-[acyl-carrier-protein] synthase II|nr:beta-ketoacyl-ACP synthase II [Desulfobulbaceae bacterium]HKJ13586.1 beta-ketoacyl-ACP synthase II [Desulfobulbales bacterium]MDH3781402.1 beta-ketoacyl-ACP synthase II [Desulfobulbaceae bacterium]MDH3921344.1 beta-ketoacyl-ACP synthase II [Desulfobulbaceae bacterium]MDH3996897.1 beta-ketoacyl-ACP synthase II [Desulfobulbaceae bacterium]